ncbi:hypothetical protein DM02DRAFT_731546 [Periconia macrospinosa]|uniref:Zn(2)-C6 fungal-type domain-containing protein n=1 Tax=Periconia macrospinosa TaxID=97972 RepID=A0A2V1DCR7_9PLEO|nr:hypothetical protein DM02DRAFT_731546 [Periconia macrospinosa]
MDERQTKTRKTPRKRALVSCDRCKLRRAKCTRPDGPEEPCLDCKTSNVVCESTLPRKKRVYGSVETLSVRFRALEALVKGMFPEENTLDTSTLFKIAAARDISMPAADDYSPADIFNPQRKTSDQGPSMSSVSYNSPDTPSSQRHNSLLDTSPSLATTENLLPMYHGVSLSFGPSSSFQLAFVARSLITRCQDIPQARILLKQPTIARPLGFDLDQTRFPLLRRASSSLSEDDDDSEPTHTPTPSNPPRKRTRRDTSPHATKHSVLHTIPTTFEEFLPPRCDADALIGACFEAIIFVPLEKSDFQNAYEATFVRKDDQIRPGHDSDWLCCLASVFLLGAQSVKSQDPQKFNRLQQRYLRFIWRNLRSLITKPTLLNIQALIRVALHDLNAGKRNNAHVLIGIAARQAMSIGLHREDLNAGFSAIEQSARKSTWWYINTIEQGMSTVWGRPTCIPNRDVSISYSNEALSDQGPISTEVQAKAYPLGSAQKECSPSTTRQLLHELDSWHASLPPHLRSESSVPTARKRIVLVMMIYYNYIRCVVTRVFLIRKTEKNISRWEHLDPSPPELSQEELDLSENCIECAYASLQCFKTPGSKLLDGPLSNDLSEILHGVLILCLDFLARPKGFPDSLKDCERKVMAQRVLRSIPPIHPRSHYVMLGQTSFQLASITGIIDPDTHTPMDQFHLWEDPHSPEASRPSNMMPSTTKPSTGWFDVETCDMPWSSFDMSMQDPSEGMVPGSNMGPFMDITSSGTDDWTTRILSINRDTT